MGFACPVCGDPQADADHLANHLAFTALIRGGDHEAWLDEHVPDWESHDEASLGERVTEFAEETEFPQVFEDTTDQGQTGGSHAHEGGHNHSAGGRPLDSSRTSPSEAPVPDEATPSEDASDVLEEARELTRRRRANASEGADSEAGRADADTDPEADGAGEDSETE